MDPLTANVDLTARQKKFLETVTLVIEENLSNERFGVEDLASKMSLSRSQLHRKIHSILETSPSNYIRNIRLEHAKKLLEEGQGTVSEISYQAGFNSPTYFNTSFHKFYGYPPGEVVRRIVQGESDRATKKIIWEKVVKTSKILVITISILTILLISRTLFSPAPETVRPAPILSTKKFPDYAPVDLIGSRSRNVMALSNDGGTLVYCADYNENNQLFRWKLIEPEPEPIPGTEGGYSPFFSPDNKWIGYLKNNQIYKIDLEGGPPNLIGDTHQDARGFYWSNNDLIYGVSTWIGLHHIPANGSTDLVYDTAWAYNANVAGINGNTNDDLLLFYRNGFVSYDPNTKNEIMSKPIFRWEEELPFSVFTNDRMGSIFHFPGFIIFNQNGQIFGVQYDPYNNEVGESRVLFSDVITEVETNTGQYSISQEGSMIYIQGIDENLNRDVAWFDDSGQVIPLGLPVDGYKEFDISKDGKIVYTSLKSNSLMILDTLTGSHHTEIENFNGPFRWLNDSTIIYQEETDSSYLLVSRKITSDSRKVLWEKLKGSDYGGGPNEKRFNIDDVSPDERYISLFNSDDHPSILEYKDDTVTFLPVVIVGWNLRFSPDGQYVLYSYYDGLYVRAIHDTEDRRWKIHDRCKDGIWASNGKIYFADMGARYYSIETSTEDGFDWWNKVLFKEYLVYHGRLEIDNKGRVLGIIQNLRDSIATEAILVTNFFELVQSKLSE